MNCDEVRLLLADDPDEPPAAARDHVSVCPDCREELDDVREGLAVARDLARRSAEDDVPPVDMLALLREVEPRRRPRVLRVVGRVAAVLLSAVGVLALFDSRVEAADGAVRLSFALPGTTPTLVEPPQPAVDDVLLALDPDDPESSVRRALEQGLVPLAEWLDERETRDSERLDEVVAWMRDVHRAEVLAMRAEMDAIRVELDLSRSQFAALSEPPALPSAD